MTNATPTPAAAGTQKMYYVLQTWNGGYYNNIFNEDELNYFMESAKDSSANTRIFENEDDYLAALYDVEDDPYYNR